ncbi:MAG: peptidoglycan DD-metalloendopeptidase family protein, partial [Vagococcus sp.]|nr:peptidoglycan DD-metalloendopeptidase family protein [Vagococcus sp.]
VSKKEASSYQEATKFLTGKYATDINYHNKLNGLIESYHLTLFDREIDNTEGFIKPFESEKKVTSNFGIRGEENHRGVDFSATTGTPILAIQEGIVVESTSHYSWGEYVKVQHNNSFTSLYAHQSKRAVEVGQSVKKGQIIGYVGSTGNSTGPHLHLELAINNGLVNALDYLPSN